VNILPLADPRWSAFVQAHPAATAFHHPDWARLVADCYGFRGFALTTTDPSGQIRTGVPMVEVRHFGGRPRWVALPFTDYLPPLVSDQDEESELAGGVREAAQQAGVRRVEVRGTLTGMSATGLPAFRHVLALDADAEVLYGRFHRSQVQRNIRRAEREGLSVRVGEQPEDLLETFYDMHLHTRRRQGVPIQPRRFFRLIWERALSKGLGSVLIVEAGDRPIAAGVFLSWNQTAIYKFGASDWDARSMKPNHMMMWHAVRTACEQGYRWLDFGRTDAGNEGLRSFKSSWGAREEPLVYGAIGAPSERAEASAGTASRVLGAIIRRGPLMICRATGELLYRYTA